MEKALSENYSALEDNILINKTYAEEFSKEKNWKGLVVLKKYCKLPYWGHEIHYSLQPESFKILMEEYYKSFINRWGININIHEFKEFEFDYFGDDLKLIFQFISSEQELFTTQILEWKDTFYFSYGEKFFGEFETELDAYQAAIGYLVQDLEKEYDRFTRLGDAVQEILYRDWEMKSEEFKILQENVKKNSKNAIGSKDVSCRETYHHKSILQNSRPVSVRNKASWEKIGGKEIYFRSRYEVRYAKLLEFQKQQNLIFDWEYEPQTFWFEGIKRGVVSYTPDFKIINYNKKNHWIEVKGYMDAKSKTKLKRFRKYFPEEEIFLIDNSWFKKNKDILKTIGAW